MSSQDDFDIISLDGSAQLSQREWGAKKIYNPPAVIKFIISWSIYTGGEVGIERLYEDARDLPCGYAIDQPLTKGQIDQLADHFGNVFRSGTNKERDALTAFIFASKVGPTIYPELTQSKPSAFTYAERISEIAIRLWYCDEVGHVRDRYNEFAKAYVSAVIKSGGRFFYDAVQMVDDKLDSIIASIRKLNGTTAAHLAEYIAFQPDPDTDDDTMGDGYTNWYNTTLPELLTATGADRLRDFKRDIGRVRKANFATASGRTDALNILDQMFRLDDVVAVDKRMPTDALYVFQGHPILEPVISRLRSALEYKDSNKAGTTDVKGDGRVPTNYSDASQGRMWALNRIEQLLRDDSIVFSQRTFEDRYDLTWGKASTPSVSK